MSNGDPKRESKEKLSPSGARGGIETYRKAAKEVPKLDKNIKYTERLLQLRGDVEAMKQLDEISYLQSKIIGILAKLKRKHPEVQIGRIRPGSLERIVSVHQLPLDMPERVALDTLNRLMGESGSTTDYIKRSWTDLLGQSNDVAKKWDEKISEMWKHNKVGTIALVAAGAAGIYVGYKVISEIWGWFKGKKKSETGKKGAEKKEEKMSKAKKILLALGIMVIGKIIGQKAVDRLLGNLKLDEIKDLMKKGKAIPAWARKKLEAQSKRLKALEEKMRAGKEKLKGKIKGAKERIVTKENKEELYFMAPRDTLIKFYCFNKRQYSEADKRDIRIAFNNLKGKKVSTILAVWNKYKHKEKLENRSQRTIPHAEGLSLNKNIKPKNVYAAVRIIGLTFELYKKYVTKAGTSTMTLKTFLEHVAKDPAYKINAELQDSLVDSVKNLDPSKIKLNKISSIFNKEKGHLIESLSDRLGIDLKGFNQKEKDDFKKIVFKLYVEANLYLSAEEALKPMQNLEPKALEAAKNFYNKVKTNTINTILPGCIKRFNIENAKPQNKDVLKKALEEAIKGRYSFKHAVQLNILSKNIDFSQPKKSGSYITEMALLYVLLHSIPEEAKNRYLSEMTNKFISSPTTIKLPSLEALKPYMAKVGKMAKEAVKEKLTWLDEILSAFVSDRSPEEQEAFIKKISEAGTVDFLTEFVKEGAGGGIRITKQGLFELIRTAYKTGKVPIEEWRNVESVGDFISLIASMGGVFFFGKKGTNQNIGVIRIFNKEFFVRPLGKVKDALVAAVSSEKCSGPLAGLKVYAVGAAPYVAIGAVTGATFSTVKGSRLLGGIVGGARGFLTPVTAPVKGAELLFRGGRSVYEKGLFIFNWTNDALKYRSFKPSQNINMLLRDAKFAHRYYDLSKLERTWLDAIREGIKHPIKEGKRLFAPHYNHRMRLKYAKRFLKRYNRFFGRESGGPGYLRIAEGNLGNIEKIATRANIVRDFLLRIKNHPDFLTADTKRMTEIIDEASKELGLLDWEIKGIRNRVQTPSDLKKFRGMMTDKGPLRMITDRLRSALKSKSADFLAKAKTDLTSASNDVKAAEEALKAAKTEKQVAKATKALEKAKKIEQALKDSVERLANFRKAQEAIGKTSDTAETAIKLADKLLKAEDAAVESLEATAKVMEEAGKVGRLAKTLKVIGIGASGVGAIVSFGFAGSRAYEALTTNVKGRAAIEGGSAAIWAANGAVDAAAFASLLGAKGASAAIGRAWAPLIPITYAAEKIYHTAKEGTLTPTEWAQKYKHYEQLYHEWFSTIRGVNLGDAWITGFKSIFTGLVHPKYAIFGLAGTARGIYESKKLDEEINKSLAEKKVTMHKIYKVLVAAQSNPDFLRLLYTEKPSDEKNKKIEQVINKSYTKYHEYYFQNESPANLQTYGGSLEFITKACIFNKIMQMREQNKTKGVKTLQIGPINIMEDRFDFTGDVNHPKPKKHFLPSQIVKYYQEHVLNDFKEKMPNLKGNMDKMETSYLLLLYAQITNILLEAEAGKLNIDKRTINILANHRGIIRAYLESARNINIDTTMQKSRKKWTLEELASHIKGLYIKDATSYKQFEKKNYQAKPGVYAVYKLAKYFGYTGDQNEADLKKFFNKDKASFQGVYWDGSDWRVQEEGWEIDETMGPNLDYKTVEKMVNELYRFADNILEYRHEALLDFGYGHDYSTQVKKMALILQSGYNEGVKKYTPGKKEIGSIAPTSIFKAKKFEEKENFAEEYGNEIKRLKGMANWSQLKHKVIDKNTIELSRSDTKEKTTIKKSGNEWSVGKYAAGLTFGQAVTMGNLLNYTKKIVKEGKWKGGSSRPFEVDGKNIDFDKAGTPFDTRLLDGDKDGNWINFMGNMGINHTKLIDILNNWYQTEYHYVAAAA